MKRFVKYIIAILALLPLASCELAYNIEDTLKYTTWTNVKVERGFEVTTTIKFERNDYCKVYVEAVRIVTGESENSSRTYDYLYAYPDLTMKIDGQLIYGRVSRTSIRFENGERFYRDYSSDLDDDDYYDSDYDYDFSNPFWSRRATE